MQGTAKEDDKDYIVRVSLSANMDLHKKVFLDFVKSIEETFRRELKRPY